MIDGNAHLAAIIEHSNDAIVSKDLDGTVRTWNRAAERIFEWSAKDMVGRSITTIIPEERIDEELSIIARIGRGEFVPQFETVRLAKSGELVPVAISVSPIIDVDGTVVGASKIAHDMRAQFRLREEALKVERQFAALANSMAQHSWMADREGKAFFYNDRWIGFVGDDFDTNDGDAWKDHIHPDHAERVLTRSCAAVESVRPWSDTFPMRNAEGEYRWLYCTLNPVYDADGEFFMFCGTNTDVTNDREARDRIELLMNEVNHRARNMLSIIAIIAHRTMGNGNDEMVSVFTDRIRSLAATHDLLNEVEWSGADLRSVISSQTAFLGELAAKAIVMSGPEDVTLKPKVVETISLAIHELATNALKYGALSNGVGTIGIDWELEEGEPDVLRIAWNEHGGPPASAPSRRGFGSFLITRNIETVVNGEVALDFTGEGLRWSLTAPVSDTCVCGP